jgi:hypothetical protein
MWVHLTHFSAASAAAAVLDDVIDTLDLPQELVLGRRGASDVAGSSLLYNQQASHTSAVAFRSYAFSTDDLFPHFPR